MHSVSPIFPVESTGSENMGNPAKIPIIDLTEISLTRPNPEPSSFEKVSTDLAEALSSWGFAYLSNHGISRSTVNDSFRESRKFFSLDSSVKTKYSRGVHDIQGYSAKGREVLEDVNVHEIKESLDICSTDKDTGINLPDPEVPDLRPVLTGLSADVAELARRLLHCLALDLGVKPPDFLLNHSGILTGNGNASALRLLHYPEIRSGKTESRVTRCGIHTDYGGLTLLFQDKSSGLEVQTLEKPTEWTTAPPIDDTIVVNIGDLLQFWSGGKYRATPHRVVFDAESSLRSRYSIAAFIHPNHTTRITPLTPGSSLKKESADETDDTRQDQTALDYILKRFSETYTNTNVSVHARD